MTSFSLVSILVIIYAMSLIIFDYKRRQSKNPLPRIFVLFPLCMPILGYFVIYSMQKPNPGRHRKYYLLGKFEKNELHSIDDEEDSFIKNAKKEDVVALTETLYLGHTQEARQQLMELAGKDLSRYMDSLYLARLDKDTEIVHYATTFIAEISRRYDEGVASFEKEFPSGEVDHVLLEEYCQFMEDYLSKGLLSVEMEKLMRKEYENALLKKVKLKEVPLDYKRLLDNEFALGQFERLNHHLEKLSHVWPQEEVDMFYLKYYYMTSQRDKFRNLWQKLDQEKMNLSQTSRDQLNFWQLGEET